jgi:hypothetical protein
MSPLPSARTGVSHFVKCFQHLFWSRTDSDVFREINPTYNTARIDKEFRGTGNVCAFGSRAAMQEIVTSNDLRVRIRQESIGVTKFLSPTSIDFWRVHTNRDDINPARFKFRKALLETPQLGVAERSPMPAIENQKRAPAVREEIGQCYRFSILVRQGEIGRFLPDPRRSRRSRHLPNEIEDRVGKETESQ